MMIVYGTKITSDINSPLILSSDSEIRYNLNLTANLPAQIKNSITCGVPFYRTHGRRLYLYSDNRAFDDVEDGQPLCYEVKDVVRFYWVNGERTIYYRLDKDGNENLLSFWFIHLMLPLYFTLNNMYEFLHAGAVEIEGNPILFIAPSMGGKSTTTQYFIRQGHTLVSDDKVPTFIDNGRFMAVGSHPYHRPYRSYEDLGHYAANCTKTFKPILVFYALEAVAVDAGIAINEIRGHKKFQTLLPNFLYTFPFLKQRRLTYMTAMLNNIKLFRVSVPWDLKFQAQVHNAICEHSLTL